MRFLFCLLILFFLPVCSAQRPEWDDTTVLHVGTEKPYATMMIYPSPGLALVSTAERDVEISRIQWRVLGASSVHAFSSG